MRASLLLATAVTATLFAASHRAPPGIKRIETVNFSNLQAPVNKPFLAPGKSKEYFIYGPWMDYADKVTFLGATQEILEKKPLFNDDGGLLRVRLTAPAATSRGERDVTIHIGCPLIPFTDCTTKNLTRSVMVLRVGTLSQITPNSNLTLGQASPFMITGTGLEVATVFTFRTMVTNTSIASRSPGSFTFTGTPSSCGTNVVMLRDQAEGGDFYPYAGTLTVSTTATCTMQPAPRALISCPTGTNYDATSKTCIKSETDQ